MGKTKIVFKNSALKEIGFKQEESGLIVQTLKALGEERINKQITETMRNWLPANKRARVLDTQRVTGWIYEAIKKICREEDHG